MDYEEMGFSKEDYEFLNRYPELYPMASSLGLTKDYFNDIFLKMEVSLWIRTQTDFNTRQLHLRSMFSRLDYFNRPLDLLIYKNKNIKELEAIFGKYNAIFALELLDVL